MCTLGQIDNLYIKYTSELENIKIDKNASIYHYTSTQGLQGIITNKELWFSNIKYLNDEQELLYAEKLTQSIAKEFLKKNKNSIFLDLILNNKIIPTIKLPIDYVYSQEKIEQNGQIGYKLPLSLIQYMQNKFSKNLKFVACFSEAKDNLPLWNYYSKCENKNGYNIEFNKEKLLNNLSKLTKNYIHGRVIYEKTKQQQILTNLISDFMQIYDSLSKDDEHEKGECLNAYWEILDICSMFFKNEAFCSEQEYRIIVNMNNLEKPYKCKDFRIINGIFIPYTKFKFNKNTINSVTISPTIKQEIIQNSLKFLLDSYDYHIDIYTSQIPIRY